MLRIYSEEVEAHTVPGFFAKRYGRTDTGMIMIITALIIIIFFVPYTASGFASVGKLFNSLFGWNYHISMIVGAVIIATYTVLGGFLAASTTDFIQSIIMTFALVIVVFFMLYTVGGLNSAISQAEAAVNGYFNLNGADGNYGFLPIVSMMSWGLGYFGMPHILLRFMAIKDDRKLKLSRRIASVWVVIAMGVAVFIGVIGYAFTSTMNLMDIEGFDPERIVISLGF